MRTAWVFPKIKIELDDLSLKYLSRRSITILGEKVSLRGTPERRFVQEIVDEVKQHMKECGSSRRPSAAG